MAYDSKKNILYVCMYDEGHKKTKIYEVNCETNKFLDLKLAI